MEDLLISRIGRCSDLFCFHSVCDVFNMRDHWGLSILQSSVLLATANISDMRRYAGIDDNVILSGVIIDSQSTEYKEASAMMDFFREIPQDWAESWQWEC